MSEDIKISEAAQQAVVAAVMAAGPAGQNMGQWRDRVAELTSTIAVMMRPTATSLAKLADDIMDAETFAAHLHSFEVEETSKRVLVKLRTEPSKRYPDGIEPIRSERTDSALGRRMLKRLEQTPLGSKILVYKRFDEMAGREGEKVRVLVHFDVIGRPPEGPGASRAPDAGGVAAPPARSTTKDDPDDGFRDPGADAPTPPTSDHEARVEAAIDENMAQLTTKQKLEVAKRCRADGIDNFMKPAGDQLDKVLAIIAEVRKS